MPSSCQCIWPQQSCLWGSKVSDYQRFPIESQSWGMSRALLAAGGGLASLGIFLSLPPPKDTRVVCSPRTAVVIGGGVIDGVMCLWDKTWICSYSLVPEETTMVLAGDWVVICLPVGIARCSGDGAGGKGGHRPGKHLKKKPLIWKWWAGGEPLQWSNPLPINGRVLGKCKTDSRKPRRGVKLPWLPPMSWCYPPLWC